jgi:hypothetical protein
LAEIMTHFLGGQGLGTNAIMREIGKSKTCVWRWQERFAFKGFEGLLRDKTRPSRVAKLDPSIAERVGALTIEALPGRGGARSGWQLLRENVDGTDLGAPVEQFLGPAEQGGGDSALEMRLAGLVAAEAVKDSKSPLINPEGVPGNRPGLLGNETEGACKKCSDLFFLPQLCFQRDG